MRVSIGPGSQGPETVLDGFTITGGTAAGLLINGVSPIVRNNIITGNSSLVGAGEGGGVRVQGTYDTVVFEDNVVEWNSAKRGGGMFLDNVGNVDILRCRIQHNTANDGEPPTLAADGGAIVVGNFGTTEIFNTIIHKNTAGADGGGIAMNPAEFSGGSGAGGGRGAECTFTRTLRLMNTLFSENKAGNNGGGIWFGPGSCNTVTNCTFYGNTATNPDGRGGAIRVDRAPFVDIRNAVLWQNDALFGPEISVDPHVFEERVTVDYSDVLGGVGLIDGMLTWGTENIDADPRFVYPLGGDLRLRSGSPANDAGSNIEVPPDVLDLDDDTNDTERTPLDLAEEPRFSDDPNRADTGEGDPPIVDMGAYELAIPDCTDDQEPLVTVPPDGTIDARQPHPVNDNSFTSRQGIGRRHGTPQSQEPIIATVSFDCVDDPAFWGLVETGIENVEAGTDPLDPNFIFSVTRIGLDQYEILLDRPISGGHWTEIIFLPTDESVCLASLPADANGDGLSASGDITALIDYINGVDTPPHGFYSTDINHSGLTSPTDINRLIDLLNGAGTFIVWITTSLPSSLCSAQSSMGGGGGGTSSLTSSADPGQANAELSDAFVTFLTTQTPADLQAANDFGAAVQSITAFCMNLFSEAELAAVADRLDDPTLVFASDAGTEAAAVVVETIRS